MNQKEQILKNELNKLKEKNSHLYQQNILPLLVGKRHEFLDSFGEFFRERGFVIKKKDESVKASYDTLHFKVFVNEQSEMIMMKGKEQIASINVSYVSSLQINQEEISKSASVLEKEIEIEQTKTTFLENPSFYYSGSNSDIRFDSPQSVLENIFLI